MRVKEVNWLYRAGEAFLAIHRMKPAALCGRQSCLPAAFQAAVQQTTHAVPKCLLRRRFSQASCSEAREFVANREGGLKGRLQARLPATRNSKGERRASARRKARPCK